MLPGLLPQRGPVLPTPYPHRDGRPTWIADGWASMTSQARAVNPNAVNSNAVWSV